MDTIKELERRAERESNQHKARLRENYSYARSLGFPAAQAKILSGWSKDRIDEFHQDKKEK